MKVVILAGGLGTRISEETDMKPKPMIEIGGKPILWHIMKMYSYYGLNDFIICCGYKGAVIKEYFSNYYLHQSDITFNIPENKMEVHSEKSEPWRVTLVNTGESSMTGGRLSLVSKYIVSIDISPLINLKSPIGGFPSLVIHKSSKSFNFNLISISLCCKAAYGIADPIS